jgi:hypothetical protein
MSSELIFPLAHLSLDIFDHYAGLLSHRLLRGRG